MSTATHSKPVNRVESGPLTAGPIPLQMLKLTVPILVAMGMQTVFALTNLFFVGSLGSHAVAGLSISLTAFFVVLTLGQSIGVGGMALIAQAWGRSDFADARRTYSQIFSLSVVCGLLLWLAGFSFAHHFVSL